jgi:hypothetical protein
MWCSGWCGFDAVSSTLNAEASIVARDVDSTGRARFVVLQPVTGGRALRYEVDQYTGKLLEPPTLDP